MHNWNTHVMIDTVERKFSSCNVKNCCWIRNNFCRYSLCLNTVVLFKHIGFIVNDENIFMQNERLTTTNFLNLHVRYWSTRFKIKTEMVSSISYKQQALAFVCNWYYYIHVGEFCVVYKAYHTSLSSTDVVAIKTLKGMEIQTLIIQCIYYYI